MFAYCTEALHLSEAEAYARITAGAAREHEALQAMLGRRAVASDRHAEARAAPYPSRTREPFLARAAHRTKREIEELVAESRRGQMCAAACGSYPGAETAAAEGRTRSGTSCPWRSRGIHHWAASGTAYYGGLLVTSDAQFSAGCSPRASSPRHRRSPKRPDAFCRPLQSPVHRQRRAARQA